MTIKKRALGKITKVETEKPKKRVKKDKKDDVNLLEGTELDDNIFTEEDEIDMAVE